MVNQVKRGDILVVNFGIQIGSQQTGIRPAICIQNQKGNDYSGTTIVAVITTKKINRAIKMPTHVLLEKGEGGLKEDSLATLEQIFTIDKNQVLRKSGKIRKSKMEEIDKAILISLGLTEIK